MSSSVPIARRASAGHDPLVAGHGGRPTGDAGPPSATQFRPDVEGLRAVAVLLVLAYHARLLGVTGGYIGVDVFFVVSGFLITGLITREMERTGTVSLPAFYARRARRLLPAALLVIVVTMVASALILPPLRTTEVAADGAASALYVGNLRFALQATDYLQADLAPSPLLHYWSLGVEEQFYLFWPALLLLVAGRRFALNRIAMAVVVVAIASFALSIVWTETDAPLAFFLLPTRAWELAVGAGLALATARVAKIPAWLSTAAVAAGLALIVAGAFLFDLETPFPGTAALVPVAGGALVLAGGLRQPLGPLSRLLALSPMRFIGRISYSLYLWHWPVLVLPAVLFGGPLPGPIRLGLALLTIPLAAASQRWVEDPIRHGRFVPARIGRALALAGTLSLTVALISMGVGGVNPLAAAAANTDNTPTVDLVLPTPTPTPSGGAPSKATPSAGAPSSGGPSASPGLPPTPAGGVPADLVPPLAGARNNMPVVYNDGCHAGARDVQPGSCVYGVADGRETVMLIGDSHAAQWFSTLERLARERGWRLISLTKSACPANDLPVWNGSLKRAYTECDTWRQAVLDRIVATHPALVVISNDRSGQLLVGGAPVASTTHNDLWAAGLARFLPKVTVNAGAVALIGDTPNPSNDPPECLSGHLDDALGCATPASVALDPARMQVDRAAALAVGATFIDPAPWLCPTDPCPVVIGRLLVYRDGHHMTTPFARALAPYLGPLLPIDRP